MTRPHLATVSKQGVKMPKSAEGHSWLPFVKVNSGGDDLSSDAQRPNTVAVSAISVESGATGVCSLR